MARKGEKKRYHVRTMQRAGVRRALVFLLCALAIAVAVSGCAASTPRSAVDDFLSARIAGNKGEAAEMTVEGDMSGYIGGEPFLYATNVSYEIDLPQAEGDRAVVVVRYLWDGEAADIPYVTRRVDTKWKVALRETEDLWLPDVELGE
jgi:hypothetical protein